MLLRGRGEVVHLFEWKCKFSDNGAASRYERHYPEFTELPFFGWKCVSDVQDVFKK